MRYHTKLPRKSLEDALFFIKTAQQIVLRLYHEKSYAADDYDFALLKQITQTCDHARLIAVHTEICLHLRSKGEPEPPLQAEGGGKP
jgi:hypothetical protein